MKKCKAEGCEKKHEAKGHCKKHYAQIRRHGKLLKRTIFDHNEFIIDEENQIVYIVLYNRKCKEVGRAIIDLKNLEKVKGYKWCLNDNGYVLTTLNHNNIYLHRMIMEYPDSDIDHKYGNPLDNRESKLRLCTASQNIYNSKIPKNNTSGYKGVTWDKRKNKWRAQIRVNNKNKFLGYFDFPEEAAKAYNASALEHAGKFAKLNEEGV